MGLKMSAVRGLGWALGVGHAHTSLDQEVEIARLRKDNGRRPAILWLGQGIETRQWIERASARQWSVGPLERRIPQTALIPKQIENDSSIYSVKNSLYIPYIDLPNATC